jgi:hypothetical protein
MLDGTRTMPKLRRLPALVVARIDLVAELTRLMQGRGHLVN